MAGVLVRPWGVPEMFESVVHPRRASRQPADGRRLRDHAAADGRAVAEGGKQDPTRRALLLEAMVVTLVIAQVGWVLLLIAHPSMGGHHPRGRRPGSGRHRTGRAAPRREAPRRLSLHGHHIAERYGLLVIIALGEGLLGTNAAVADRSRRAGRPSRGAGPGRRRAGLRGLVDLLRDPVRQHPAGPPRAVFGWGYGHIPLFGAVVAVGAGLHAAAYRLDSPLPPLRHRTVLTVVSPWPVRRLLYLLYAQLTWTVDPFHLAAGGSCLRDRARRRGW